MAAKARKLKEKGQSNREIGQELHLSEATVEWLLAKASGEIKDRDLENAKKHENLLEFEEAAQIYKRYGMDDDVIRVRKEARNKVSQTVVHGDYVDDRDTIVKDSVVNKSNIGGGGSSKMQELKELKEMFDSGFISKEEMEDMKKEILGKTSRMRKPEVLN